MKFSTAPTRAGLLYLASAKLWFLLVGFALQFLLPKALHSRELFGAWTIVLAWVSGINNVVVTGTIQAVSHFAREGTEQAEQAKRTALRMQLLLGLLLSGLFVATSPWMARLEGDIDLTSSLRLAGFVVFFYSFYAVFVGAANGQHAFYKQAGLDVLFATLRTLLIIGCAWWFHSVIAGLGGFVVASVIITALAIRWVGWPNPSNQTSVIPLKTMFRVIASLLLYLLALNELMFLDIYSLKALYTRHVAHVLSLDTKVLKPAVDALVGTYGAVLTVVRVPYQLLLAVTFVVFPVLSSRRLQENPAATKQYIANTLRYCFIFIGLLVVGLGVRPEATMRLLFGADYSLGAVALPWLLLAYTCFSLLSIIGTILNSLGCMKWTILGGWTTLLATLGSIQLALVTHLPSSLKKEQISEQPLVLQATAQGTMIGFLIGFILFLFLLWKKTKVALTPMTLLRTLGAAGVAILPGWLWPLAGSPGLLGSKFGTFLCGVLAGIIYLIVLFVTGELSLTDLRLLRNRSSIDNNTDL